MDMEGAIKQIQETTIVMSGIHAKQAEALKQHGEWLASHTRAMAEFDRKMIEIEDKVERLDRQQGQPAAQAGSIMSSIGRRR
jgi:predicted RecB family endonuclease